MFSMSYVHVLIIKDDKISLASMHYRYAMNLIANPQNILPCLKHRFLDAGYLVLDLNRKTIVNGQGAFPLNKSVGKRELFTIEM